MSTSEIIMLILTAVGALLSIIGTLLIILWNQIMSDVKRAVVSIEDLNKRVAVLIEKTTTHESRLGWLEENCYNNACKNAKFIEASK